MLSLQYLSDESFRHRNFKLKYVLLKHYIVHRFTLYTAQTYEYLFVILTVSDITCTLCRPLHHQNTGVPEMYSERIGFSDSCQRLHVYLFTISGST